MQFPDAVRRIKHPVVRGDTGWETHLLEVRPGGAIREQHILVSQTIADRAHASGLDNRRCAACAIRRSPTVSGQDALRLGLPLTSRAPDGRGYQPITILPAVGALKDSV